MRGATIPKTIGETTITGKNQVSLPAEGVRTLGWERGDRLTVKIVNENTLLLTRRPQTAEEWVQMFSGKLGHVFGDHEDNLRYLDEVRAGWDREPDDAGR